MAQVTINLLTVVENPIYRIDATDEIGDNFSENSNQINLKPGTYTINFYVDGVKLLTQNNFSVATSTINIDLSFSNQLGDIDRKLGLLITGATR